MNMFGVPKYTVNNSQCMSCSITYMFSTYLLKIDWKLFLAFLKIGFSILPIGPSEAIYILGSLFQHSANFYTTYEAPKQASAWRIA
jgi:hypothetical protein